jgi:hypothetical protein
VLAALVALAGCRDYLSGPDLSENPNAPTNATADQLFTGVQVATFALFETQAAQVTTVWDQQTAGVARQWQNYADYSFDEFFADGSAWQQMYAGGGLTDIRKIQASARAANNRVFLGIAQAYEALVIGTMADWFGDIPYGKALQGGEPPTLDKQSAVYAAVQAVLDSAIANLSSGQGGGPGSVDFVYGGDRARWARMAHTLKARYAVHASARQSDSLAAWARALAEARQGITSADGDFVTVHGSSDLEANLWYQFLVVSRAGDIDPGKTLVDLLNQRGDATLLARYFRKNAAGAYVGSPIDRPASNPSAFNLEKDTPVRLVTAAENQMLLAEAQYRTGDASGAAATLNAFRATLGQAPATATGAQLLAQILLEKYTTLFLNPESWQDYLRTCVPNLALPSAAKATYVPARFYYANSERVANPNIPEPNAQPKANANFPKNARDPLGAACVGQANRPGT